MRTLILRILSLLVVVLGLLLLATFVDPTGFTLRMLVKVTEMASIPILPNETDWTQIGTVAGLMLALAGLFGLRHSRREKDNIHFRTEHGDVVIALAPIQRTLTQVIRTLPEVRRAHVKLRPDSDGRHVEVRAEVVLKSFADQNLRRTAALVSECIAQAVTKAMGLGDLATVSLVVKGIDVDTKKTALRLRDEAEARQEREKAQLAPPTQSPVPAAKPDEPASMPLLSTRSESKSGLKMISQSEDGAAKRKEATVYDLPSEEDPESVPLSIR
jgi:hypothetical protein